MLRLSRTLAPGKKAYFASDFHLGSPDFETSLAREKKLVRWLNFIGPDCQYLFLVGDLFDFWFDYQDVIPKGYIRFLGKLAEMADSGVEIFLFTGNHDMWMFGYLEQQLQAKVYRDPIEIVWETKTMVVGHGDGLGPGDGMYKLLKRIFANKLCQRLFAFLHPRIGMGIANAWSAHSRIASHKDEAFLGEKEFLWTHCKTLEAAEHHDYYIFGHRHLPMDLPVGNGARYINLGEWMNHCKYLAFDGNQLAFLDWEK